MDRQRLRAQKSRIFPRVHGGRLPRGEVADRDFEDQPAARAAAGLQVGAQALAAQFAGQSFGVLLRGEGAQLQRPGPVGRGLRAGGSR